MAVLPAPWEPARSPDCSASAKINPKRPRPARRIQEDHCCPDVPTPGLEPCGGSQGLWDTGGQSGFLLLRVEVSVRHMGTLATPWRDSLC